jgi:hypothetical protein
MERFVCLCCFDVITLTVALCDSTLYTQEKLCQFRLNGRDMPLSTCLEISKEVLVPVERGINICYMHARQKMQKVAEPCTEGDSRSRENILQLE